MKSSRPRFVSSIALLAGAVLFVAPAFAAETINVGTAYRTGSTSNGFPEFLNGANTNGTTRAWNLNGADQTLNSIALDGNDDAGYDNGLTIVGPGGYGGGYLNWAGDPQAAAKNNISNTGLFTVGGSWSVDIAATEGVTYTVEVLSNPVTFSPGGRRSLDVTVDGSLFADNLFVPAAADDGDGQSVVHRFDVVADADGIDIVFGAGGDFDGNPYVTGLSVTASLDTLQTGVSVDFENALVPANVQAGPGATQISDDPAIGVRDFGGAGANWWNHIDNTAAAGEIVDSKGNVTGITVSTADWNGAAADWHSNTPVGPADVLVSDGLYRVEDATPITTTIGGLVAGQFYGLIVYHADDYVSESVTANGQAAIDYSGAFDNPGYTDAFGLSPATESDFWYFQIAANGAGQIVILTHGSGSVGGEGAFNTLTGFQLFAIPAPAALPAGLTMLGLIAMRRRR